MITYIALHRSVVKAPAEDRPGKRARTAVTSSQTHLLHGPYLDTVPPASDLRTPLFFTPGELLLLQGTNILGATLDRKILWTNEYHHVRAWMDSHSITTGPFTLEDYLHGCTLLSSRAFPSSIMDPHSDATSEDGIATPPDATPVLFPGVDTLNHRRGQAVAWVSGNMASSAHREVSVVQEQSTDEDEQVFNSYGPKSNEEVSNTLPS